METVLSALTPDTKVKVFSHNDLDGIGCGIVARLAFRKADITYCGYNDINDKVKEFIVSSKHLEFDQIFITDISVNKEVEELINETTMFTKTKLLDHHATATHLNSNLWAFVSPTGILGKNSGTNMLYEYLKMNGFFKNKIYSDALTVFVEKVRRYDSWEWKDMYNDIEARDLNDLFWLYGVSDFERTFVNRLNYLDMCIVSEGSWKHMFGEADRSVLSIDHKKKVNYINRKNKQMFTGKLVGKQVGFVFAEQYISELGNELSDRNQDLAFIVIIDMGAMRVSYRTIHDHINLGKDVAGVYGGGGHPKASGSEFDITVAKLVVPLIFGSEKLTKNLVNLIKGKGIIAQMSKLLDKMIKK